MDRTIFKIVDNEKFYFVNNHFIRDNLLFLNSGKKRLGDRQINNLISKLEKLGMIQRNKEIKYERYVKVNDFLILNWNINDLNRMTASQKIQSFNKVLWQTIINEYGTNKDFDKWILYFDTNTKIKQNETILDIATALYQYCKTALSNQRLRK